MGNFDFRTCMHVHVFAEGWISYFDIRVFVEFSQAIFEIIENLCWLQDVNACRLCIVTHFFSIPLKQNSLITLPNSFDLKVV